MINELAIGGMRKFGPKFGFSFLLALKSQLIVMYVLLSLEHLQSTSQISCLFGGFTIKFRLWSAAPHEDVDDDDDDNGSPFSTDLVFRKTLLIEGGNNAVE